MFLISKNVQRLSYNTKKMKKKYLMNFIDLQQMEFQANRQDCIGL